MARRNLRASRSARFEQLEPRRLLSTVIAVGAEFRVNTYTTNRQLSASVAMDADGDFVVAWTSMDQDGSGYGVYAQRFDAAGMPQGAEFRVNTYTTGRQFSSRVAVSADGDFVIAWGGAGLGDSDGVFARRYNDTGVAQGDEFRVNTYTLGTQQPGQVAYDADGNFVVAWNSDGQDGSSWGVYVRRYDAAGIAQGNEFRVNTYTTGNQGGSSVAMDADGDFVIVWSSYGQDGSQYGMYAQRYNANGIPQGAEFRVNTYTTQAQLFGSVAMDNDGDFVIAWNSTGQDGSGFGVYAQRYDAAGTPQRAEFRANTYTTNQQIYPKIAMDSDGDFVVTWSDYVQDGSGPGIYAQRYDAEGDPLGGEFRVNTYTTSSQSFPKLAMDADGDFVVAWPSLDQDGSSYGVYAQRYAVVPEVTASSFQFATAPHKLSFTFDRDVSGSLGTDDLVVQNLTTMQTIPSSDFSISYDTLTNIATFTYTGTTAGILGMLPDGNYTATLLASGVTTIQGAPLAQDYVQNFHFLQGDADNDGRVNLNDFNILAANFGQSARDFTQGDFDYDTIVDLNDFNILAGRFGQILAAPQARMGESMFGRMLISHALEDPLEQLV